MGLRARILRVVAESGPRNRNILRGLAVSPRQRSGADKIINRMIEAGELAMIGAKRGARYGLPASPRKAARP